ncbi:MAG TPA: beta-galactosidase, partial [Anaerolineae bacterium]|nr:beta-galactosidase [Anaerolineae bacterium]
MYIGADYYPEHWPKERWETDAQMMQAAGFNVVRLAEFAWVNMEPQEGRFEFAWLDEALATLARHDIRALLCTPTAVMPAWVARAYPETLAMQTDGTRVVWGVRKNNCFTSGAYRLLSERITRAMAEHFKDTPNVIGWQTDNEFGGPVCYCDTCR